jgi:L-aminopeptidase/D-esterase-like protein
MGFPTAAGPVPIVVALALFDLLHGDPSVRPGPDAGYAACVAAGTGDVGLGAVGAGTGATAAKWQGRDHARPAGLGGAVHVQGDLVVAALVAVNAFGDFAGLSSDAPRLTPAVEPEDIVAFGNTTIGIVATNGRLTKLECHLAAQSAHDGLARAVDPAHTLADGDAFVVAATGAVDTRVGDVRSITAKVVESAVREALARK